MTTPDSKANEYGILIDYEYCTNCHTCEVACKKVLDLPVGQYGINWNKIPVPTDLCDLCAERTAEGRLPSCVHHCQSGIMYYGTLEELAAKLAEKPKMVLFSK